MHWQAPEFRSLAQLVAELDRERAFRTLDSSTIESIYRQQYREQFGKPCRLKQTPRTNSVFGRLQSHCIVEDIDPATFIATNMAMLKESEAVRRYGFQPSMLSGDNAKARYNMSIRKLNRRVGRATADAVDSDVKAIRRSLYSTEMEVASFFVALNVARAEMTWQDAIDVSFPTDAWREVFIDSAGPTYARLKLMGTLDTEKRRATLTAALSIAESYQVGLSHRIAVPDFSWEAFSELMVEHFTAHEADDLPELSGVEVWP